jgi:hypothetical protein
LAHPSTLSFAHARGSDAPHAHVRAEETAPAVSWAAVGAGAFAAASISLILLALGTGVGLSSISPWSSVGAAAARAGVVAICWMIASQMLASALGGYLAGRLRTKWTSVHSDEVYFRDTAHGFLVWAVGMVVTAAFLTAAATTMAGGAARAAASGVAAADPNAYYVDGLFRSTATTANRVDPSIRAEVGTILANDLRQPEMPAVDKTYLSGLVASTTGLSPTEADARVAEISQQARLAADTAKRSLAHLSYWTFLGLLVGAFSASLAATVGGRQRDHMKAV